MPMILFCGLMALLCLTVGLTIAISEKAFEARWFAGFGFFGLGAVCFFFLAL